MRRVLLALLFVVSLTTPVEAARWLYGQYTPVNKNGNTTDAQTDTTLWDPAADFRVVLQGCVVSADATQTIQLEVSNADVFPDIYLAANTSVLIGGGSAPIYLGAVDGVLAYTTSTSANTSIVCWGWEDQ
jgi:hypothetical protein